MYHKLKNKTKNLAEINIRKIPCMLSLLPQPMPVCPCWCAHADASIPVCPCWCAHARAPVPMHPCQCAHADAPMPMRPCRCVHAGFFKGFACYPSPSYFLLF